VLCFFLCSKEHFSIFFVQYLGVTAHHNRARAKVGGEKAPQGGKGAELTSRGKARADEQMCLGGFTRRERGSITWSQATSVQGGKNAQRETNDMAEREGENQGN
jgi:hypothetical protein